MKICHTYEIPAAISTYFSIKNSNPKYDIIIFINGSSLYETNYLKNIYLKYDKISKNNITILKKLFDVVIETNLTLIKCDKLDGSFNYDFFTIYSYTEYSKILIVEYVCLINKNIDFLFDKYEQSTYMIPESHQKYTGGLFPCILLINTSKYYIKKAEYLCENYKTIFNNLTFFIPIPSNILYFVLYPHWNNERFENNLIDCTFIQLPDIETNYKRKHEPFITYYFGNWPFYYNSIDNKFKSYKIVFKIWDENVKKFIDKYPQYSKIFEYIKTYRYTYF